MSHKTTSYGTDENEIAECDSCDFQSFGFEAFDAAIEHVIDSSPALREQK